MNPERIIIIKVNTLNKTPLKPVDFIVKNMIENDNKPTITAGISPNASKNLPNKESILNSAFEIIKSVNEKMTISKPKTIATAMIDFLEYIEFPLSLLF